MHLSADSSTNRTVLASSASAQLSRCSAQPMLSLASLGMRPLHGGSWTCWGTGYFLGGNLMTSSDWTQASFPEQGDDLFTCRPVRCRLLFVDGLRRECQLARIGATAGLRLCHPVPMTRMDSRSQTFLVSFGSYECVGFWRVDACTGAFPRLPRNAGLQTRQCGGFVAS